MAGFRDPLLEKNSSRIQPSLMETMYISDVERM